MDIEITYNPETDEHFVKVKFTGAYLVEKCDALPVAMQRMIASTEGLGIIEDAILMAHGYQLKPKQATKMLGGEGE